MNEMNRFWMSEGKVHESPTPFRGLMKRQLDQECTSNGADDDYESSCISNTCAFHWNHHNEPPK